MGDGLVFDFNDKYKVYTLVYRKPVKKLMPWNSDA